MTTVAVFGATGNVGQALLPHLVLEPEIKEIRVVTSRPECIGLDHSKRIAVTKGDYCTDEAIVTQALRGCHRLFVILPQSLSSQDMIQRGKFVADCAMASGVKTLVRISSLGIDAESVTSINHAGSQGPLGDAHVAVEKYCAEIGLEVVSLRPTSYFSNLDFNLEEIKTQSTISTPLGTNAKVNWVSCEDIAKVAANVLAATQWDKFGRVINITGPKENTFGAEEMALTLSLSFGKAIVYKEVGLPPVPDYAGLWSFLRNGGFDYHCDTVERITGNSGLRFSDIKFKADAI